jgi:hypothetical protein
MKKLHRNKSGNETTRVLFADGSTLITYPDGGMLIVESDLARQSVLKEQTGQKSEINYVDPPPRRPVTTRRNNSFKFSQPHQNRRLQVRPQPSVV